jgi:hypothetical protein
MNCDARGRWLEDLWLICGELGLRATVPAVLQCPRVLLACRRLREGQLGLLGREETPAAGIRPRRQERRVFLLISYLIRLIHLLSLNREDYLIPKQGLDLIPKPNPNGPLGPLNPWHVTKHPSHNIFFLLKNDGQPLAHTIIICYMLQNLVNQDCIVGNSNKHMVVNFQHISVCISTNVCKIFKTLRGD